MLVQISRREGQVPRVPRGQEPVIELDLETNQRVVQASLRPISVWSTERKIVDWRWEVFIEARIEPPAPSEYSRLYDTSQVIAGVAQ